MHNHNNGQGVIVADGKTSDILTDVMLVEAHGLEKPLQVQDFEKL